MKDAVNVLVVKPNSGLRAGQWGIPTAVVRDGEQLIVAADRVLKELTGLSTVPKRILFPVELVTETQHRIVLVGFSECASSGDPKPNETLSDARFVDPRSLGDYQTEGMDPVSIQAFSNFSAILVQQAQLQAAQAARSGIV